jgi:DNA-directed RNA polymerase subunit M/transcription elongation factor TFIIS
MFFCPNCNNSFDITKLETLNGGADNNIQNSVEGGAKNNYEDIIDAVIKGNDDINNLFDNISIDDFVNSNEYKKLKSNQKELVYNKIQDSLPKDKKKISEIMESKQNQINAYFICNNCGYLRKIENGTLVFSRVSTDIAQSYATSDMKEMIHSDILPRTRKYSCTNTKCISHTDPSKREAVFFRMNNTFKIKYICLACETTM